MEAALQAPCNLDWLNTQGQNAASAVDAATAGAPNNAVPYGMKAADAEAILACRGSSMALDRRLRDRVVKGLTRTAHAEVLAAWNQAMHAYVKRLARP